MNEPLGVAVAFTAGLVFTNYYLVLNSWAIALRRTGFCGGCDA